MNEQEVVVQRKQQQKNEMRVAGFLLAILGLLGFFYWPIGVLSLAGAFLCFLGMFSRPSGLAIVGFILGLAGSAVLIPLVRGTGLLGISGSRTFYDFRKEFNSDMSTLAKAIKSYKIQNGSYTRHLSLLRVDESTRTDPWENEYIIEISDDGKSFKIKTSGEDGLHGTTDDFVLHGP